MCDKFNLIKLLKSLQKCFATVGCFLDHNLTKMFMPHFYKRIFCTQVSWKLHQVKAKLTLLIDEWENEWIYNWMNEAMNDWMNC